MPRRASFSTDQIIPNARADVTAITAMPYVRLTTHIGLPRATPNVPWKRGMSRMGPTGADDSFRVWRIYNATAAGQGVNVAIRGYG